MGVVEEAACLWFCFYCSDYFVRVMIIILIIIIVIAILLVVVPYIPPPSVRLDSFMAYGSFSCVPC